MKANHNKYHGGKSTYCVVRLYVKDTFWKQITTLHDFISSIPMLFVSMSKIHFESKSQRMDEFPVKLIGCSSLCQRYILKANHNKSICWASRIQVVRLYVKDTFWKQITTPIEWKYILWSLFVSMSKIHFESKSQQCLCRLWDE